MRRRDVSEAGSTAAGAPHAERTLLAGFVDHAAVLLLCRLAIGGIFLYAALPKIEDPAQFARDIANYRLLPGGWPNLLAVTTPWIELMVGVLLVLGVWVRGSAVVALGMLVVFAVAIGTAAARGLDISCGCFGKTESAAGWGSVARNAALCLPAFIVVWRGAGAWSLAGVLGSRR